MSPWWQIVWTLVDSTPCQIFCAVDLWFKITTDHLTINFWSLTFDWSLMLHCSCKIFGMATQKSEKVSGIKKAWSPNILSIIWYILPGSNNCNLYYYLYRAKTHFVKPQTFIPITMQLTDWVWLCQWKCQKLWLNITPRYFDISFQH